MERHFIPIVATLAGIISPKNCQESFTYSECKTSPDAANEEKVCKITDKKKRPGNHKELAPAYK